MSILVLVMILHTYVNLLVKKAMQAKENDLSMTPRPSSVAKMAFNGGEKDQYDFTKAHSVNCMAKIGFVVVLILFQVIFWAVSMSAYLAGPDAYLEDI